MKPPFRGVSSQTTSQAAGRRRIVEVPSTGVVKTQHPRCPSLPLDPHVLRDRRAREAGAAGPRVVGVCFAVVWALLEDHVHRTLVHKLASGRVDTCALATPVDLGVCRINTPISFLTWAHLAMASALAPRRTRLRPCFSPYCFPRYLSSLLSILPSNSFTAALVGRPPPLFVSLSAIYVFHTKNVPVLPPIQASRKTTP